MMKDVMQFLASQDNVILCNQVKMIKERGISLWSDKFYSFLTKDKFHSDKDRYKLMTEFL